MVSSRKNKSNTFLEYVHSRIEGMSNGSILHRGNHYSTQTIYSYTGFYQVLRAFETIHKLNWGNLNDKTVSDFVIFMEGLGYMKQTVNKNLAILKSLLHFALDEGYSFDTSLFSRFPHLQVTSKDVSTGIYLTDEELQALFEMKLDGLEEIARDVFLVGCYTSQRFSDYSRISKSCFSVNDGVVIITLNQHKTGTEVSIPVLNDNLLEIFKKWNYHLPQISCSILNSVIKDILKRLSATVPSLKNEILTQSTARRARKEATGKKRYKHAADGRVFMPRYMLVSSHTARRTGITLMYLSKVLNTREMMSISGHKTESVFNEYIKFSGVEMATDIARKMRENSSAKKTKNEIIKHLEDLPLERLLELLEKSGSL